MSTRTTKLLDMLAAYGDITACRCLGAYWNEWGGLLPMTAREARAAYRSLRRAQRLGMLPKYIALEREAIRDIVLVRRGVDLRQRFARVERRKIVSVRYADGRRVIGDQVESLGPHRTIRDITGEIVRVALEM